MSGEVPEGWATVRFGDAFTLQRGFDLPVQDRSNGPVPVIASNGIVGTHSVAKVAGPGVVTGRSGTIGKVQCFDGDFWPLNTTLYVRDWHGNDVRFGYYYLQNFKLERYATGTGVPTLNRNVVHTEQICVPPLPEQRKIAEILTSVDHAIQATEAVIEQTKKVKQGVMNRLLTKGIGHTRFKQTEIGEIPEGWEVSTLEQVGRWMSGGTPSKENPDYWNGQIPWVSPKDMKSSVISGSIDHVTETGAQNGTRLIQDPALLIVVRGMILAKTVPVAVTACPVTFNQDIKALNPDRVFSAHFVRYWLEHRMGELMRLVASATHGTKRLPQDELEGFSIPRPSREEQDQIVNVLTAIEAHVQQNQLLISQMKLQKSALMADLLTGRKRVSLNDG